MKRLITFTTCLLMSSCASAQQVSKKDMDDCYLLADAGRAIALAYSQGTSKVELVKMFDSDPKYIEFIFAITNAVDRGVSPDKISDTAFVGCVESHSSKVVSWSDL